MLLKFRMVSSAASPEASAEVQPKIVEHAEVQPKFVEHAEVQAEVVEQDALGHQLMKRLQSCIQSGKTWRKGIRVENREYSGIGIGISKCRGGSDSRRGLRTKVGRLV